MSRMISFLKLIRLKNLIIVALTQLLIKFSLINPFVEFCYKANEKFFGLDLYPLKDEKLLNYNIYETNLIHL